MYNKAGKMDMNRYLTENQLNEMAVFRAVAIDKIGAESVQYYKHVLKIIIYGDSTGNLYHWAGEVAQCLSKVNDIIVKPTGKKLKPQDYLDCFLLGAGDTVTDYEDDLRFVQQEFKAKYPPFTVTPELSQRSYQAFIDLADYFAPILSSTNNYSKEWFRSKVVEYFKEDDD